MTEDNVQTLHFWLEGESFTRLVRQMWQGHEVRGAILALTDGMGMDVEQAVELLTGKGKLVGDTREGDHTLSWHLDDNKEQISVENMVFICEQNFVKYSQMVAKTKRKLIIYGGEPDPEMPGALKYPPVASARAALYRKSTSRHRSEQKVDQDRLKKFEYEQKYYLDSLDYLYPLVGKSIKDLPISEIGTEWSDIEEDHYQYYNERVTYFTTKEKVEREKEKNEVEEKRYEEQRKEKLASIKPQDIKNTSYHSGWISPNGDFFPCNTYGHISLQDDLVELGIMDDVEDPIHHQWIQLSMHRFYINSKLTDEHISVIMDYMTSRNLQKIRWMSEEKTLAEALTDNEIYKD